MHLPKSLAQLYLLTLLALVSCGTLAPAPTQTLVPPPPTQTPAPTPTPPPIATRPPAPTARPTAAPTATPPATAAPTAAPTATAIPTKAATRPPAPSATPEIVLTSLAALPNLAGQEVTVQAAIVWITSFSKGVKFILDDGTGQAALIMWQNVYDDCWAAPQLLVGATVQARGTVGQYESEWQIEPGFGGDVKALAPGALAPVRQVSSLSAADVSTRATVEGTVSSAEGFSGGQRVYVDDGTGTLQVLLWQNIFDRVKDNALLLTPGTRVRVEGVVQEYKGTLELVPQVPHSVLVNP